MGVILDERRECLPKVTLGGIDLILDAALCEVDDDHIVLLLCHEHALKKVLRLADVESPVYVLFQGSYLGSRVFD